MTSSSVSFNPPNCHVESVAVGFNIATYVDARFAGKGQHGFDHISMEYPKRVLVCMVPVKQGWEGVVEEGHCCSRVAIGPVVAHDVNYGVGIVACVIGSCSLIEGTFLR